ncbi:hypothetical protein SNEBB_011331 [Seison nebaliae]|nr:hypothetical protein SNEBB_011331 [Seison nebaliae]
MALKKKSIEFITSQRTDFSRSCLVREDSTDLETYQLLNLCSLVDAAPNAPETLESDFPIGTTIEGRYEINIALKLLNGGGERDEKNRQSLCHEYLIYKILKKHVPYMYRFSTVYAYGRIPVKSSTKDVKNEKMYEFISMQLHRGSIHSLQLRLKDKLSLKSISYIGIMVLLQLSTLHNLGLVYNNLSTKNIVVGKGNEVNKIYLIDFSRMHVCSTPTKQYGRFISTLDDDPNLPLLRDENSLKEEKITALQSLFEPRMTSKNQTLRMIDDIESLAFLLIYLHLGILPWSAEHIVLAILEKRLAFSHKASDAQAVARIKRHISEREEFGLNVEGLSASNTETLDNSIYTKDPKLFEPAAGLRTDIPEMKPSDEEYLIQLTRKMKNEFVIESIYPSLPPVLHGFLKAILEADPGQIPNHELYITILKTSFQYYDPWFRFEWI